MAAVMATQGDMNEMLYALWRTSIPKCVMRLSRLLIALQCFFFFLALPESAAHVTPTQTLAEIERELKADPNNVSLLLDKAHMLQIERSLDACETILKQVDALESPRRSDAIFLWVSLYLFQKDYARALELSEEGVARFPENPFQWQMRGQVLMHLEDTEGAVSAFARGLQFDESGSQRGYVFVARVLLDRGEPGDKRRAIAFLNQAIEKLGDLSELHHMCMRLERELGNYDAALSHIDRLVDRFGNQITFALKRAEILEQAERFADAIDTYKAALVLMDASNQRAFPSAHVEARKASIQSSIDRLKGILKDAEG